MFDEFGKTAQGALEKNAEHVGEPDVRFRNSRPTMDHSKSRLIDSLW
jgi:hypothetical protein